MWGGLVISQGRALHDRAIRFAKGSKYSGAWAGHCHTPPTKKCPLWPAIHISLCPKSCCPCWILYSIRLVFKAAVFEHDRVLSMLGAPGDFPAGADIFNNQNHRSDDSLIVNLEESRLTWLLRHPTDVVADCPNLTCPLRWQPCQHIFQTGIRSDGYDYFASINGRVPFGRTVVGSTPFQRSALVNSTRF